jgi:hypothetical protein
VAKDRRNPITKRTLDDVVRYFTEELGYEKDNPALRWKIWEQFLAGRMQLKRHWKEYLCPEGGRHVWASKIVDPSHYCGRPALDALDFDRHGHLRFDPAWGNDRYTIVEPCDFRAIWPPPVAAPVQQPGVGRASEEPTNENKYAKDWVEGEVGRMVAAGEIREGKIYGKLRTEVAKKLGLEGKRPPKQEARLDAFHNKTKFAEVLVARMSEAAKTDESLRRVSVKYLTNHLEAWLFWPLSKIK